tara:strand:- start:1510 stop:2169 length:660 start_codon:yes stop_codon:yes gene_type:complete
MNTKYNTKMGDELKNPFPRCEYIINNFSQAYQDLFALTMLRGKEKGRYIEIGSNHPLEFNNTFLLESVFGWKGISVEILPEMVQAFTAARDQPCYEGDATKFDWTAAFKENKWKGKRIDYASVDCEPAMTTYEALRNLPHADWRFSVISYEHDVYKDGPQAMNLSREFLKGLGYELVATNICNGGNAYEDWWIDPSDVPASVWGPFISDNTEARSLFVK